MDELKLDDALPVQVGEIPLILSPPVNEPPVVQAALKAIGEIEQPRSRARVEGVITPPPAHAERVNQAAKRSFPDPAKESLMAAIRKEEISSAQILRLEGESNAFIKNVDRLLDLTSELNALPDQDKVDFNDKIKAIFDDLKANGIDLWKGESMKEISKEKVAELKSLASTHTDKNRTQMQLKLSKMQSVAQDLMAILESAKGILREDSRSKSTFTRNQRVTA